MNETSEWLETAKQYGLAVDLRLHDGDRFGYVRQFDASDTEHNWIRVARRDSRWGFVTEQAVRNAIDRILEYGDPDDIALRNPDDLVTELERDLPSKAFVDE